MKTKHTPGLWEIVELINIHQKNKEFLTQKIDQPESFIIKAKDQPTVFIKDKPKSHIRPYKFHK